MYQNVLKIDFLLPRSGEGEEVRDGRDNEQDARVHHATHRLHVHRPPEVSLPFRL